jgi:hypothetical protein
MGRVGPVAQDRVCEILQKKSVMFLVHRVLKYLAFWMILVETGTMHGQQDSAV